MPLPKPLPSTMKSGARRHARLKPPKANWKVCASSMHSNVPYRRVSSRTPR